MEKLGSDTKIDKSEINTKDLKKLSESSFLEMDEEQLKQNTPPKPLSYNELVELIPINIPIEEKLKEFNMDKDGSLKIASKDLRDKQKAVLKKVFTQAAAKLLEGKNVVGLSLPVNIFQPRSSIERCCDLFRFFPYYMGKVQKSSDIKEQIKFITAAIVAASQYQMNQWKPFNPILGETFQGILDENTNIYVEHISHHPAISYYLLIGKGWKCKGYFLYNAKIKPNKVVAYAENWNVINFDDGKEFKFCWPALEMGNFILGTRKMAMVKNFVVKNEANKIKSMVKYNHEVKRRALGLLSQWKMNDLQGKLYYYDEEKEKSMIKKKWYDSLTNFEKMSDLKEEIENISGNWLEELKFNDKVYWNKNNNGEAVIQKPVEEPLPSSYRFREDLIWLSYKNEEEAQKWKILLEVQQRKDRKIRQDGYKEIEKKNGKKKKGFFSMFSSQK